MLAISTNPDIREKKVAAPPAAEVLCYHCGTPCIGERIAIEEKSFCCDGCKLVYEIINENDLCDYYNLQSHPGLNQIKAIRSDKYAYLDNEEIARQLYQFTDGDHTMVVFYIPGIHCSSCMWLLEHLNRLNSGITESRMNFSTKEVTIRFSSKKISLRKVTELLATIGYEPYISLDEAGKKKSKTFNKQRVFKLGVAGFCFGNIMMMSFPEYLSTATGIEEQYAHLFRYLNLILAIPVFFYSASDFFVTAWKGMMQKTLNIDAPIALAIIITFTRSIYEILSNTGAGYLDSMSGIVFFMLVGRVVQERTYRSLSFARDYKSYFPIAVNVQTDNGIISKKLQDLVENDVVQLHNDEIIPADAVVLSGKALVDYSFVTGESEPVEIKQNGLVYAGGKQTGDQLTIRIVKPVAGSYLTSLWNHYAFSKDKADANDKESVIHVLSKYFTVILFVLAAITAGYWYFIDPSKIINSVSAMLIVACPCALLLSATFTNGNILRLFSNNGLFLRDASVIESLGKADHIVFDKTGTITQGGAAHSVECTGHQLSEEEKDLLYAVVKNSKHPNSKSIAEWLGKRAPVTITSWKEIAGKGIESFAGSTRVLVGSATFAGANNSRVGDEKATVYVSINDTVTCFHLKAVLRDGAEQVMGALSQQYDMSLLSGDNDKQKSLVAGVFENGSDLLFDQKPIDKLQYVEQLQFRGKSVLMIGDGLNDAGALQQSNVGVTISDDINNFTPSCDAILDARKFNLLPSVLKLAKAAKMVIGLSFVVSIVYNIIGLYFAMRGMLQPVSAAILMPCSTLSIVIISSGFSSLVAWRYGLRVSAEK
jgi:P-type Cu+ transporter